MESTVRKKNKGRLQDLKVKRVLQKAARLEKRQEKAERRAEARRAEPRRAAPREDSEFAQPTGVPIEEPPMGDTGGMPEPNLAIPLRPEDRAEFGGSGADTLDSGTGPEAFVPMAGDEPEREFVDGSFGTEE
jgi:hypothetical protein